MSRAARRGLWLAAGFVGLFVIGARGYAIEAAAATGTRTPIKHLIVVVGENHSFDNVFATYTPPNPTQHVWNLLSLGIVNQLGLPGPSRPRSAESGDRHNGLSVKPDANRALRAASPAEHNA